ncbi:MAG: hypothetical protein M3R17_02165 [Bacteroidota bacterium]|nr:hypothetical protein [Bacteroidota bacterium]
MKKNARAKIIIVLLVGVYIATGFLREFIFLNINEQSRITYYNDTDSHVAPSMQWLSGLSYSTLYYAKWPLTLLFTAYFAFIAAAIVKNWFRDKNLVKITWMAYGITFAAGLIFYLAGSLTGARESTYAIARFLAGLTETPALLVMLLASFMALRRNE